MTRARAAAVSALQERAKSDASLAPLSAALEHPRAAALLAGIFSGSPFLTGLIERDPVRLAAHPDDGAGSAPRGAEGGAGGQLGPAGNARRRHARAAPVQERGGAADGARRSRRRVAGAQRDRRADRVRRRGAAMAPSTSCFARRRRAANGWPRPTAASRPSGYIVLAMGKYGAGELNYSSDIDLIVFYDRELHPHRSGRSSRRASSCA